MQINTVELKNFRNYTNSTIRFGKFLNFIVGKNAQGKTNLLESVYLVSVGKSPKNSKDKQIINFNAENAKINLEFSCLGGNKTIQLYLNKVGKKAIKINNLNILKLTELVGCLNVVYFSPDELKLIKEVPEDRRNFLDISISQFNKPYLYELLKYNRILKMRNQILKSNNSNQSKIEQLALFTPQLVESAEKIINTRLNFLNKLKDIAFQIHQQITQTENLEILYSYTKPQNTTIKQDLTNQLNAALEKELELGFTTIGPHRDDIIFKINNQDCKFFASQGQQRTVALVVKLSLMEVIKNEIGEYPILLLDDVLSELDTSRQERLLNICTKYQTLITTVNIPQTNLDYTTIKIENGNVVQ